MKPGGKDVERDGQRGAGEDGRKGGHRGDRDEAEGVIPLHLKELQMTNISGRGTGGMDVLILEAPLNLGWIYGRLLNTV